MKISILNMALTVEHSSPLAIRQASSQPFSPQFTPIHKHPALRLHTCLSLRWCCFLIFTLFPPCLVTYSLSFCWERKGYILRKTSLTISTCVTGQSSKYVTWLCHIFAYMFLGVELFRAVSPSRSQVQFAMVISDLSHHFTPRSVQQSAQRGAP